ncbi:MAG: hypothetical protein GX996_01060 [Firmicutes bacterium]|nr:hypothetical protein [Bacillota bacterium]
MDVSRAKTVLIYTFLILNIFLISQILLDKGGGKTGLFGRKEEMSKLEAALQQAGLFLETSLPKDGTALAHIVVEPWHFKPEEIILDLYGAFADDEKSSYAEPGQVEMINETVGESFTAYRFEDFELHINKKGVITFKKTGGEKLLKELHAEEMEQIAYELCRKIPFLENYGYDYSQKNTKKTVTVNFSQDYEGFPLYAGYLHFLMEKEALVKLCFYRLEPRNFVGQEREIIPPSTALLRFAEIYDTNAEVKGKTEIIGFSLGFYSRQYDAERWEIPPVWRIRLNNDEIYYVNAFTGILEQ